MLSAEVMKKAFETLKEKIKDNPSEFQNKSVGKILMATVEGDVHDIGKNIVIAVLESHGFEVVDLGKNVPGDRIVEEAKKGNFDFVGLSALMTTTMMEMKRVIKMLKAQKVDTKVAIGGAVVSQDFASKIGADIYAKDAFDAITKLKKAMSN